MASPQSNPSEDVQLTTVPLIINGQDVYTPEGFNIVSPSTGDSIWTCCSVTRRATDNAVAAASQAFATWSATKPAFRRAIFLRVAAILEQRATECHECMAQETGAAQPFLSVNTDSAAELLRDLAGRINRALSGQVPVCEEQDTHALVLREPYGVVLGIAPWNAPFILGIRAVAYALAAGNTCVLKGSEFSPRCFWLIGSIFREAGLPDGCLNVIYHRPEAAAEITTALIEHSAVRKVNFTGSAAVGRIISAMAGRNLKPTLMELGGKSSAIVCEDADLNLAAKQCAVGAFLHSGQICMSTERILVYHTVMHQFTESLKAAISTLFGPKGKPQTVVQPTAVARNRHLIEDAVSKGATIIHGNHTDDNVSTLSPFQLHPTVVQGVAANMDLYQMESFGPTVSLIAVESDEQAIAISNDTEYGLSGAVFTQNLAKGLTMAKRIQTGAVHINSMSVHDEAGLPHGGFKGSGWGRFNADAGLEEFLQIKTITFKQ